MVLHEGQVSGSFRDPSGHLFVRHGELFRQVNLAYQPHYDRLMASGLYGRLVEERLLIPHEEADLGYAEDERAYKVLRPERLDFVSYPYEWCFSQLRDAALLTLAVQRTALEQGMTLKDSSAYNVQFQHGRPIFIDTLSFEQYREGTPWVGYRQFCQHFLAPLAVMHYRGFAMHHELRLYMDGVPLHLASQLLPSRTRLNVPILTHLHLHAQFQQRYADHRSRPSARHTMPRLGLLGLLDSLESAVRKLRWQPSGTEWAGYYADTNYSAEAFDHKRRLVSAFLGDAAPQTVWDLGGNTGEFSRIASEQGIATVCFDVDPAAVELNYRACRQRGETRLLPLIIDLTNPSPGIGWGHVERMSLRERGPADMVMALALIHHLAIANNVPFGMIARFFRELGRSLIVEFVPKSDSQVQRLLATREDVFVDYTRAEFERAFLHYYHIRQAQPIRDSQRILYLMTCREG